MKKTLIPTLILALVIAGIIYAQRTIVVEVDKRGERVEANQVYTNNEQWVILDSSAAAGTEPSALAVSERTYQLVKAAIAADIATPADGDLKISVFDIPREWNAIRFRAICVDNADGDDNYDVDYAIYAGTLGAGYLDSESTTQDCDLAYVCLLEFVIGTQDSMYRQVAFTSGSDPAIQAGDTITGDTSASTAVVVAVSALSGGTWGGGDAAGTLTLRTQSAAFQSETLSVTDAVTGTTTANNCTIGADLVEFEYGDTLVVTESDWPMAVTTKSPAANTIAETTIDLMGADVLVIVPITADNDCKLLGKGY